MTAIAGNFEAAAGVALEVAAELLDAGAGMTALVDEPEREGATFFAVAAAALVGIFLGPEAEGAFLPAPAGREFLEGGGMAREAAVEGAGMDLEAAGSRATTATSALLPLEQFSSRLGLKGTRFVECLTARTLNTSFRDDFSS